MKSSRFMISAAALLAVTAVPAAAAPTTTRTPTVRVQASDFRYCPASAPACSPSDNGSVTVKVGTRVVWIYTDHACDAVVPCPGHNVLFKHPRGSTKLVKRQGAVILSTVFTTPGKYSYWCSAHRDFGMTGTVIVKR